MWMWEIVYAESPVTDYAKSSFCGSGYKMQKSHNADQTKKIKILLNIQFVSI